MEGVDSSETSVNFCHNSRRKFSEGGHLLFKKLVQKNFVLLRTITNCTCPLFYLFICELFNDAISSSDYTVSNNRMINK
jgi:hypothetical protein